MTERTIRSLAKELAAVMYEDACTARKRGEKLEFRDAVTNRLLRVIEPELFLKTYPTLKDYWAGRKHGRMESKIESSGVQVSFHVDDGSITKGAPGWAFHYKRARDRLVRMLGLPDTVVHPQMKEAIAKALIEDREKQLEHEYLGSASPFWDPGIPQAIMEP